MIHSTSRRFWQCYEALPSEIRELADKNYRLLQADPNHSSLHFKKIGALWSARVGRKYRALGLDKGTEVVWFWIGTHAEYESILP